MRVGSGPAPRPTLKTALCQIFSLGGAYDKYRGVLNLGDAQQEPSLGVGLLKKIVVDKKEYIGRKIVPFRQRKFGKGSLV